MSDEAQEKTTSISSTEESAPSRKRLNSPHRSISILRFISENKVLSGLTVIGLATFFGWSYVQVTETLKELETLRESHPIRARYGPEFDTLYFANITTEPSDYLVDPLCERADPRCLIVQIQRVGVGKKGESILTRLMTRDGRIVVMHDAIPIPIQGTIPPLEQCGQDLYMPDRRMKIRVEKAEAAEVVVGVSIQDTATLRGIVTKISSVGGSECGIRKN